MHPSGVRALVPMWVLTRGAAVCADVRPASGALMWGYLW